MVRSSMVAMGYGTESDLEHCEENGNMPGADPECDYSKKQKNGAMINWAHLDQAIIF